MNKIKFSINNKIEEIDRWGVHERGYLWIERDTENSVHLSIFPLADPKQRIDFEIPRELIREEV